MKSDPTPLPKNYKRPPPPAQPPPKRVPILVNVIIERRTNKMNKPGQLSEHFHRPEFACECGCGFDTVDAELINVLEGTHAHFSAIYAGMRLRIVITGGNRCFYRNEDVQLKADPDYEYGTSDSTHMVGIASDFKVQIFNASLDEWIDVSPIKVFGYLTSTYPDRYGIGGYLNRTHLDVRPDKARWHGWK